MKKMIPFILLCILSTSTSALAEWFSGKPTDVEVSGGAVFFKVNGGVPHTNPACTSNWRYQFVGDKDRGLSILLAAQMSDRTVELYLVEDACYDNYPGIHTVKLK